jgi:predicted amidohydrolase YtcJ
MAASAMLLTASGAFAAANKADLILVNGNVWTGDPGRPRAQALAVRATTLMAVGSNAEIRRLAEKHTEIIDLRGRFAAPGFVDAHLHLVEGSLGLDGLDLVGAPTAQEIRARVAAFAKANPDAPWITGRGWSYAAFGGGLPEKALLDEEVPGRPVFLTSYDGHTGWASSAALAAAEVTKGTADPAGGTIVRDARGEPTGVLKEAAMQLVASKIPSPSREERYRAVKKGLDLLASYGLTSVHEVGLTEEDLPVFERLLREGALKVRIACALPLPKSPSPEIVARYDEIRRRFASPRLRVRAVKGYVDGVVETRTAAMLEPYPGGGMGLLNWPPETLAATIAGFDKLRYQVLLHAIGDRAIRVALDAFERAAQANGPMARRHRVEHVEVPDAADLPRFKALGVVASTQALFANPDQNHIEAYLPTLGSVRAARAMPFRSLDGAGAVQAFGSDWPVCSCEVLKGIYCAVTRTTPEGRPPGGWEPSQRISIEAALSHFTKDGAYASQEEDVKGVLARGKLADVVVLSRDILASPPEELLKTSVLLTLLGGQVTYRSPQL